RRHTRFSRDWSSDVRSSDLYVLFDEAVTLQDSATKARYCPLLIAIGEHQQQLASEILEQWKAADGMAAQLSKFPNERYADAAERSEERRVGKECGSAGSA